MTAREKAIELVYEYQYLVTTWDCYNDEPLEVEYKLPYMKQCALITVNEILSNDGWSSSQEEWNKFKEYYQQVKQEIEVL